MDHLFVVACFSVLLGFVMAWAVGANDVANAMGTSVGARVLTISQAVILAGIFEVLGALFASDTVTTTLSNGLVDLSNIPNVNTIIVAGMLSALAASATWLILATALSWPVSTTHSIVGAILGYGWFVAGANKVQWSVLTNIVLSWVLTPTLSAILAALVFKSVQVLILDHAKPIVRAKIFVPIYLFIVSLIIVLISLSIGGYLFNTEKLFLMSIIFSVGFTLFGYFMIKRVRVKALVDHSDYVAAYNHVEKMFGVLAIFTASAMAFAHGGNDVANAIGPLARIIITLYPAKYIAGYPYWVTCVGALGVVTGLSMYGYKIIKTVGHKITALTPIRGFSAQFSTAFIVVVSSTFGLPISTTHTLVGAVIGVGIVGGLGALNFRVIRGILYSWFVTVPVGALLSIIYFHFFKHFVVI